MTARDHLRALAELAARWQERARQLRPWSPPAAASYDIAAAELEVALREEPGADGERAP